MSEISRPTTTTTEPTVSSGPEVNLGSLDRVIPALSGTLRRGAFPILFLLMVAFFSIRVPVFWSTTTLINVINGSPVLLLLALAMSVVVVSGGIDLSIDLSFAIGAWGVIIIILNTGLSWLPALVVAVIAASLVGLFNAFLVTKLRISPFLATLSVYFIGRSVQKMGTNGGGSVEFYAAPSSFHELGAGTSLGLNNKVWIALVVFLLLWFVLSGTVFGRRINAIGLQRPTAENIGIPVSGYLTITFVISAMICALAGALLTAQLQMYTPLTGYTYQNDAISAVFIGASMSRSARPNVPGTVIAVIFLSTLGTGLDLMGLDFNLKVAIRGFILVLALAISSGLVKDTVLGTQSGR